MQYIYISLAHLPWIPCSSCTPSKRSSRSPSSQERRQAQGSEVWPPSELPELELSPTALLTRCKVCGGREERDKRFLVCSHSECFYKYYHIRCLTTEQIASDVQMGSQRWYCPSCLCRVCLCDTDDDKIILCDCCDQGYHLYCLSPPKRKVPTKYWDCDPCKKRREKKRILMLHRHDYDEDILKSGEIHGPNLLLKAAEMMGDKVEVDTTSGK